MPRKVFYSFHYNIDHWRVQTVRNIGSISGNTPCNPNDWETLKRTGDKAVKNWIDNQLHGCSTVVVLVGQYTYQRKWIKYEIQRAWQLKKAIMGIYIHNIKDKEGYHSPKGRNPFEQFTIGGVRMSDIIKCHDSPYRDSKRVYKNISENMEGWIEEANNIRALS